MTLTPLDAVLLSLRDAHHGGSWERMLTDLRWYLEKTPRIHHAVRARIARDIERVEELANNSHGGKR